MEMKRVTLATNTNIQKGNKNEREDENGKWGSDQDSINTQCRQAVCNANAPYS